MDLGYDSRCMSERTVLFTIEAKLNHENSIESIGQLFLKNLYSFAQVNGQRWRHLQVEKYCGETREMLSYHPTPKFSLFLRCLE